MNSVKKIKAALRQDESLLIEAPEYIRQNHASLARFCDYMSSFRTWLWISILMIPASGMGLVMLGVWALYRHSWGRKIRAHSGMTPNEFAKWVADQISEDDPTPPAPVHHTLMSSTSIRTKADVSQARWAYITS